MKKIKLGQEIEIPETHKKGLINMHEQINANLSTINDLSILIKDRKDSMWVIIKQILPETKEYNCQYNSDNSTVKIINKKLRN